MPSTVQILEQIADNIDFASSVQDKEQKEATLNSCLEALSSLFDDGEYPSVVNYYLGLVLLLKKLPGLALHHYKIALETAKDTHKDSILNNLGAACQECARFEEALSYYHQMSRKPYGNIAVCYTTLGLNSEALEYNRLAAESGDSHDKYNLALSLLSTGHYKEGFDLYDNRLLQPDRKEKFYKKDKSDPYWDGTEGKKIVIHGEQGLGDEIMFASMLPDVMQKNEIIYDCNPRLEKLMRRSFPDIVIYPTKTQDAQTLDWPDKHEFDCKLSIASLAKFYRNSENDFPRTPYLKADPVLVEKYRQKLAAISSRPKIGFSWYGGSDKVRRLSRFNALKNWESIFSLPCDFISLQYNEEAAEKIENFCSDKPYRLHHWPEVLADYDETAALLMNLDFIVSAPQSVIHLAGALGVSCVRLCPIGTLWVHGEYGKNAPWYNSVQNIWQTERGNWSDVMEKAYNKIKERLC